MNLEHYTIQIYLFIEGKCSEYLKNAPLQTRVEVNKPSLTPAEVITIEVLGEIAGNRGNRSIWRYIDAHWRHFFPQFPSYKTFARLVGYCGMLKAQIVADFAKDATEISIIDGLPMPLCKYVRANRCKRLEIDADFGYCAAKDEHYYGLKGHCLLNCEKQIVGFSVCNPKIDERAVAFDFLGTI